MKTHGSRRLAVLGVLAIIGLGPTAMAQAPKAAERYTPTDQERGEIEAAIVKLSKAIDALPQGEGAAREALPDIAVYLKAGRWALRLGEFYGPKGVPATLDVLARGLKRAEQLADGRRPWVDEPGSSIRGYVSKVDGSVQPYAVIVPPGIDRSGQSRMRLDVVLHGRGATLNEVQLHPGARRQARGRRGQGPGHAARLRTDQQRLSLGRRGRRVRGDRGGPPTCFRSTTAASSSAGSRWGARGRGTWGCTTRACGHRSRRAPGSPRRGTTPGSARSCRSSPRCCTSTTRSITPPTPSTCRSPATAARTTPSARRRSTSRRRSRRSATR